MEKNKPIGCGKDTEMYHNFDGDNKIYWKCGEGEPSYRPFYCEECHKVKRALDKKVGDRTEEDHLLLAKYFKGVRNYLLSMGSFKEERKYFIYICKECGLQLNEKIMGKKCPECETWTYHHECINQVKLNKEKE